MEDHEHNHDHDDHDHDHHQDNHNHDHNHGHGHGGGCHHQVSKPDTNRVTRDVEDLLKNPLGFITDIELIPARSERHNAGLRCVLTPPAKSLYSGLTYPLTITIPPGYPTQPPLLRFASIITHSQISALGHPSAVIFDQHNLNWEGAGSEKRTLRAVLEAVHQMLLQPLKEVAPDAKAVPDEDLYHDYVHTTEGRCIHKDLQGWEPEEAARVADHIRETWTEQVMQQFTHSSRAMHGKIHLQSNYKPLHPELFDHEAGWDDEWFVPSFVEALSEGTDEAYAKILTEEFPGVFSFEMFRPEFCQLMVEELKNFEQSPLPKSRPNSMNKYGVILDEIGMERMFDQLVSLIGPMCGMLYADCGGGTLDHHHAFVVQYAPSGDRFLDMHTDDSDVTLNVCLVEGFQGGELDMCGQLGARDHRAFKKSVEHKLGRGLLHRGTQRHGARNIKEGERNNLILWCRSSTYRMTETYDSQHRRHREEEDPSVVCLSKAHDPDYYIRIKETPSLDSKPSSSNSNVEYEHLVMQQRDLAQHQPPQLQQPPQSGSALKKVLKKKSPGAKGKAKRKKGLSKAKSTADTTSPSTTQTTKPKVVTVGVKGDRLIPFEK